MKAIAAAIFLIGCSTGRLAIHENVGKSRESVSRHSSGGPPVLVYKTKANYDTHVPVILSDEKTGIVAYPAPMDVITNGQLAFPTPLHKGYLLDNRGIGTNVAFLELTYEAYSRLENPPPVEELYRLVIDKDPLTEIFDCGNKKSFDNLIRRLNEIIDRDSLLSACRSLK